MNSRIESNLSIWIDERSLDGDASKNIPNIWRTFNKNKRQKRRKIPIIQSERDALKDMKIEDIINKMIEMENQRGLDTYYYM